MLYSDVESDESLDDAPVALHSKQESVIKRSYFSSSSVVSITWLNGLDWHRDGHIDDLVDQR